MNADLFVRLFAAFGLLAASAAAAPLVARKRRAAGILNLALVSAAAALLLSVSAEALFGHAGHAVRTVSLGPVAVPFLVDGFSAVFLAVIAFMAVTSALYSVRYMDHYPEYGLGGYYLCYPLFVLGMAALVTIDDLALGFTSSWPRPSSSTATASASPWPRSPPGCGARRACPCSPSWRCSWPASA
ncbi:MAG: hypothetical protein MUE80_08550 [Acidobacteria bacterium]|nr:hypothetical protein [Acidobacteriota bacterium]